MTGKFEDRLSQVSADTWYKYCSDQYTLTAQALILATMILTLISFALIASVTAEEQYKFDFTEREGTSRPSILTKGDASLSARMLQSNSISDPCYFSNDKIVCIYPFVVGSIGNETKIEFMAECDNTQYGFDFRRASNCACLALVTPAHGTMKKCPCTVCGVDLGETPVSVDCSVHEPSTTIATTSRAENVTDDNDLTGSVSIDDSVSIPADNVTAINSTSGTFNNTTLDANNTEVLADPFIFSTCSSIDCFGACNGTCSFNCNDPSGNVCSFCETYTGSGATTSAPTGSGNNQIGGLDEPPQASPGDTSSSNGFTIRLWIVASVATASAFLI